MAEVVLPYADPGRASFEVGDNYTNSNLLAGHEPKLGVAHPYPLANNANFAQFSVVGLTAGGVLAMAEYDGDPKTIGVLNQAASLGATGTGTGVVWHSGNFNIDALVWHASFDTDAKKLAAFRGSPTPTNILANKR